MIDVTQDIHSLTTFKRNSSGLMKRMKKTGRPLVLTVNGKAEAVLLEIAEYAEEWLTSAQAMGLAERRTTGRVMPWDRTAPVVTRRQPVAASANGQRSAEREYEYEYEL